MGIQVAEEHDPQGGISLSYQDFLDGVARMREVGLGAASPAVGANGVELLVRYRLCGHRGHAEEESAK
jgi:hypothetical protein